ncbi:MAG: zinc-binding dehydrogenase [bacterium]|nr:zinc-binding dehydrogenase [bacterium]
MTTLPTHMRAVVLDRYEAGGWRVEPQHPVPTPGPFDLLIRVRASPLNPSDLSFMIGQYGIRKPLPVVPGFEAAGQVVAVGERLDPADWIGRRVACFAGGGDGTYAEYMATNAALALPLPDHIDDEAGAMMLVNPLTAWALIDMAQTAGASAVVQTAAASALGQMLRRFGEAHGLAVINIVRRAEQLEMLRAGGAEHVLDSSSRTFDADLRERSRSLNAVIGFDAVGGSLTDRVLRAMPNGSRMVVYGGLEGTPVSIGVDQLIFRDKRVEGFWLSTWMPAQPDRVREAWRAVTGDTDSFRSDVRARCPLEQFGAAVEQYAAQMSGGKVLIVP